MARGTLTINGGWRVCKGIAPIICTLYALPIAAAHCIDQRGRRLEGWPNTAARMAGWKSPTVIHSLSKVRCASPTVMHSPTKQSALCKSHSALCESHCDTLSKQSAL
jgi:hypothetical protein